MGFSHFKNIKYDILSILKIMCCLPGLDIIIYVNRVLQIAIAETMDIPKKTKFIYTKYIRISVNSLLAFVQFYHASNWRQIKTWTGLTSKVSWSSSRSRLNYNTYMKYINNTKEASKSFILLQFILKSTWYIIFYKVIIKSVITYVCPS